MIAMPAPAPVNVSVNVKLNPTPKQKVDAPRDDAPGVPRFDDALKQARAKPAKSEKPHEAQPAAKAQRSSQSKPKSTKRAEEPADAPPPSPPGDAGRVDPERQSPDDAPPADIADEADRTAMAGKPAPAEVDPANLAAVGVVQTTPVNVTGEQSPAEEDEEGSAPAQSSTAGAVRAAAQSNPSTTLATETVASAEVGGIVAPRADEESAAAPEGAVQAGPTVKPQKLDVETTSDQPQDIAIPTIAKPQTKQQQQQQHGRHQHNDQPPEPVVASSADAPLNVDEGELEQQAAPVELAPGSAAGEATIAQQPASAAATAPAPADVLSAAPVAPKSEAHAAAAPAPAAAPAAPTPREVEFARANHDRIVTDIRAQLLPKGGAMQIRLDPPQLGALQVAVHMLDGVMSVSFETSNSEATQMLSHSLTQLKHVLESHGVSVDKLHVQQAPRNEQSSNNSNDPDQQRDSRHGAHDDNLARQEQQRKEMLRRMWRRLALGSDPLDLVA
jgi:flagellar hook-length control protein FliK